MTHLSSSYAPPRSYRHEPATQRGITYAPFTVLYEIPNAYLMWGSRNALTNSLLNITRVETIIEET